MRVELLLHRLALLGRQVLADEGLGLRQRFRIHTAPEQHGGALRRGSNLHRILHIFRPMLGAWYLFKLDVAVGQLRFGHGISAGQTLNRPGI
ncbi:MAG: hypothetical protein BWZ07_03009 [Alphaproteobacteria bacterium ADurb.BinA280]|nr:MAG: hypothetical protein BWZ07_03009 [Alphaproteobacteria bacterium ADurb.BinA280]